MTRLETWSRISLILIGAAVAFTVADIAEDILVPTLAAIVAGIVMSPLTDRMEALGLPSVVTAIASLCVVLGIIGIGALMLEPMVYRVMDQIPGLIDELNQLLLRIRWEMRGIENLGEEVGRAMGDGTADTGEGGSEAAPIPSLQDALMMAPAFLSQVMIFVGVLFFFIMTKSEIYGFAALRMAPADLSLDVARRLRAAERQVGRYFLTITAINAGYAVVVTAVMAAIGMPGAMMWGLAAGLLNYVLYLGPATMVAALVLGGLIVFEGPYSFLPAAAYLAINLVEAQFVTPALVGRALKVNALLIFLSLIVLMWIWGPAGGIIAIPLLLWVLAVSTDLRNYRRSGLSVAVSPAKEPNEAA